MQALGCSLCAKKCSCFEWSFPKHSQFSMELNFSSLVIFQVMIVIESQSIELWLKKILLKFQYTKEESGMCQIELFEFTKTLQHECENKTIFEA